MSGSTIGGVVGGVIGWFVGGPAGAQWGWMIGSAVGAVVDPQQFEGPRLNEARTQTAQDGVPLIYGYGTFPCHGNLIWVDSVKEHRKKESAKGGPETITYSYTVSYAITVCKGPISGYKLIKRNGKIVYDARTNAELTALGYTAQEIQETRAAQAAFMQRATLYYGTNDQMPDPTMVAVLGAGEVPAYTGIAYIVLKDDETREGEVSQYEFVVASCGERTESWGNIEPKLLITGTKLADGAGSFATARPGDDDLNLQLISPSTGANIDEAVPAFYGGVWCAIRATDARYSSDGMVSWQSASNTGGFSIGPFAGGPSGWIAGRRSPFVGAKGMVSGGIMPSLFDDFEITNSLYPSGQDRTSAIRVIGGQYYVALGYRYLVRSSSLDGPWEVVHESIGNDDTIGHFYDVTFYDGAMYATVFYLNSAWEDEYQIRRSHDGGATWPDVVVVGSPTAVPFHLEVGNGVLIAYCWGGDYVYTSANGWSSPVAMPIGTDVSGINPMNRLETRRIAFGIDRFYIVSGDNSDPSKANKIITTTDGLTFSEPEPLPLSGVMGIAYGSGVYVSLWREIPDAPGFYVNSISGEVIGPEGAQVAVCKPTLGEIVADQCDRRGILSRDVSELTDEVDGYRVATPSTPQRNIQGLQPGYFFSASEYDGTLHFPKRGRALTFALTHDDFVERDGDPIQWERTQEPELLRKVTVGYIDPDTTYTATTQQAERRSATVSAEGESTIELAITGSKDWAAQVADKSIKVAWGEVDECTFHVTIDHAELVVGAEGTVPFTDGTTTVIRIERIEDEGLVRMVKGRRTRANLYESNASGAAKPLPRFPGSNVRGPTDGLMLNIPVLVDSNDVPGIHWAAASVMTGWQGGELQILRAGQWLTAGIATTSAAVGSLLSPLPAHAGDIDTSNVLHVQFNDDLESVTFENLLQERNPLAILRDDGTAEIVQFQTATEIAPGEYELTTILRGRLATSTEGHDAGARVVFLDDRVHYAPLEATDVGTTISYRFVSLGTDPDAAPVQEIDLATMESQREWPVYDLQVEQDGDDFILTWHKRDRLGTDVFPIRSSNWAGYEVGYSYSGGDDSVIVQTESHTFTIPGASDITFSVAQINQYTGAGPAQTVTIP